MTSTMCQSYLYQDGVLSLPQSPLTGICDTSRAGAHELRCLTLRLECINELC